MKTEMSKYKHLSLSLSLFVFVTPFNNKQKKIKYKNYFNLLMADIGLLIHLEFTCINQDGATFSLKCKTLKLVDQFI